MAAQITDDNFDDEVVQSALPVLVDFHAAWCGPCKMLAPTIDEVAAEMEGKAKIVKVDVDEAPETAEKYQVRSVPTLIYFKGGEPVDKQVGVVGKDEILNKLESL